MKQRKRSWVESGLRIEENDDYLVELIGLSLFEISILVWLVGIMAGI